ncbi:heat shock protein [Dinoroseobacter phage vB_DshS-R5C]|uniref:Heat shock protein n=1 Tax=Dinoroseobacter phage vB_DshS-R5C TaxID=1965368 RepID=A0A1V0DYC2_9CAUD|nr:heat shock protein [Dinoroseobacter phage vB_DshS-R5C]ARB06128.1 heat shock protein [Dinoroseobacter phage vB_DshS-R5C]
MTDELMDELEADGAKPSTDLADVKALAHKQLELEAKVARAEQALKDAQKELMQISDRDLPAALKAAGIPSFTLDNGMKVAYKEDLKVSVPKKNLPAVLKHMREWGYEANISTTMTIDLGKGNDNAAKALAQQASEMGLTANVDETIATGTVKKVLNQRIDEGKSDDLSLFGAFPFTRATVK